MRLKWMSVLKVLCSERERWKDEVVLYDFRASITFQGAVVKKNQVGNVR